MALYEHIFIARPDISPQQVEGLTDMIGDTLKEQGGRICKQEYWGLKTLAYPIQKNVRGHYTLLNIDAEHAAMLEVERKLRLSDDVLRHMSLRVEEHEEGESIQLRNKNRDERRRAEQSETEHDDEQNDEKDDAPVSEIVSEIVPEIAQEATQDTAPEEQDTTPEGTKEI